MTEYGVALSNDQAPLPSAYKLDLLMFGDSIDRCVCLAPNTTLVFTSSPLLTPQARPASEACLSTLNHVASTLRYALVGTCYTIRVILAVASEIAVGQSDLCTRVCVVMGFIRSQCRTCHACSAGPSRGCVIMSTRIASYAVVNTALCRHGMPCTSLSDSCSKLTQSPRSTTVYLNSTVLFLLSRAGNQTRECSKRQLVSCVLPAITLGRQQIIGVSPEGPYFQDKKGSPAERVLRVRRSKHSPEDRQG